MSDTDQLPAAIGPSAPPFDSELAAILAPMAAAGLPPTITREMVEPMRRFTGRPPIEDILAARDVTHREFVIPGFSGDDITLSVFTKRGHQALGPGFLHTHGGGMIMGDRFTGVDTVLEWVEHHDGVCVSVEYRLAPEFPDPYPIEDSYAALLWTAEHATELGIDLTRLIVAGASAGGGLAAGIALLARDRQGPALLGQVLIYPMLDDRNTSVSSYQIQGIGTWDRASNFTGWSALLGDRCGSDDVSSYSAPGRSTDLGNLPATYIDCGSAEVFRDEDIAYASGIWAAGGVATLHVWAGGYHGFDMLAPQAALSQAMIHTRTAWVDRLLSTQAPPHS